jgi:hypothetical protein
VSLQKAEKPEKLDDWSDRRLQMEVEQASEKVWAAAEAWVEAEAEAEEQEWQLLALGINSYLREAGALSDEDGDPEDAILGLRSPLSSHNSPKQFPGMGLGLLPGDAAWGGNFVALSPEQRAIWDQTPPSRYGANKTLGGAGQGLSRSRAASRSNLTAAAASAPAPPVAIVGAPLSTPVAADKTRQSPTAAASNQGGMSILTGPERSEDRGPDPSSGGSPGSSRRAASAYEYRSPSESPTEDYFASGLSSTAASGGRSLHDKLSSPDRKKSISPSEALRRYEERLSNAESNRDQSIAERVQKAQIASERVRAREQREALRKATVLTAIEAKQRNVEERRNQFLKSIQSRANNETTKVHEVNLTNALNSEIIAQRLEEVETRIMAASVRRFDSPLAMHCTVAFLSQTAAMRVMLLGESGTSLSWLLSDGYFDLFRRTPPRTDSMDWTRSARTPGRSQSCPSGACSSKKRSRSAGRSYSSACRPSRTAAPPACWSCSAAPKTRRAAWPGRLPVVHRTRRMQSAG